VTNPIIKQDTVTLYFRNVPAELRQRLKVAAARKGVTMEVLVRRILDAALSPAEK